MTGAQANQIVGRARRAGWTITALAERIGCSRETIYRWRDEDCRVSRAIARNLRALQDQMNKGATAP